MTIEDAADVAQLRLGHLGADGWLALKDHASPLTAAITTFEEARSEMKGPEKVPPGLFGIGLQI